MAKILIVDDRPTNREFLVTLLGYKGHQLLEAADGMEALQVVRSQHPNLVICDVLMPTMDGFAFVQQLRSEPAIAGTSVVFCTAHYLEREAEALARNCGVSHVLTKPAEPQLVLDVVDKVLLNPAPIAQLEKTDDLQREHLRLVTDKLSQTAADLRSTNERLAALVELNLRLASELDPQRLLEQVCLGARQLLGARYGALGIRNRENSCTSRFIVSGFSPDMAKAFGLPPIDRGILGNVMTGGSPYRLARNTIDATAAGLPEGFAAAHSLVAAPVVSPTGVYGWICLTDKLANGEFSDEDARLLAILAAQTGRIHENGSLYRKVQEHAAQLEIEIAERRRMEQEIRETENFLASVLDNIPNSVFVKDANDLRFVRINNACERLNGYTSKDMVGKTDHDLFPREQADFFVAKDRETLAGKQQLFITEEEITGGDGTTRMLRTKKFPIVDAESQPRYLLGMSEDITEQKLAERRLQESEGRFRQLIEQASDGIFVIDPTGRFRLANSRCCEMLGYPESELLGQHHEITYVLQDPEVSAARMREAQSGSPLRYERSVRRKDGGTFPAEFSSRMLDTGEFQVIFRDISDRRRAEEAIRESESKYRSLIEQASDGIFISDAEGNFVMVNTRGCELLGYAPGEIIGKNGKVTYLDPEAVLHTQRMQAVAAGKDLRFERMIKRKDGTAFPAEISLKMLDNGMVQVIFHDITERRRNEQTLINERSLLRTLVDALPDIVFTKDAAGRFTMCNLATVRHLGMAREADAIGKSVFDVYPAELARRYNDDDQRALADNPVLNREEIGFDEAGRQQWYLTIKVPLRDAAGNVTGMVGVSREITERKEHEQKIARLSRIQSMLSGINSCIVRVRTRDELFREACRIATDLGAFPVALIGLAGPGPTLEPVAWGGDGEAILSALQVSPRGSPAGVAMKALMEQRTAIDNDITLNPDIDPIRTEAIARGCRSAIGLPLFREKEIVGVFLLYGREKNLFDAEEIKLLEELAGDVSFSLTFIKQQEKVDYLAYFDPMTGLPNRSLFFDRLARQLASAERERSSVALILLDIDRFRMVNDTLGRQAGDMLLQLVSQRIKESVRDEDTVARTGADGFAIAVAGSWRIQDVAHLMETRSRALFAKPFTLNGEELRMSATAGVAVFPGDAANQENLVANAEAALRSAKQQNVPLLFYGPEMNAQAADSLRIENRLRRALERKELVLWYQPKVDLKTGRVTGMEALMRWQDPETGMVPPMKFIPVMEQTGMILDAGAWALTQVAVDSRLWVSQGINPPRIAVNVSPIQLRQKDFVAQVIEACDAAENAGGCLDLEITESVIMENVDAIIPKLQTIRGLGVQMYIDDFGTGYSSLAYIARLPIHALKIDRSFVVGMTQSEESLNIVNSVISLAHSLKLRVVAEGVETEAQAALLGQLNCDEFQGYLISKPVPPEEVPALFKKLS